jgi:membrane-associated phospholipid phosphatase
VAAGWLVARTLVVFLFAVVPGVGAAQATPPEEMRGPGDHTEAAIPSLAGAMSGNYTVSAFPRMLLSNLAALASRRTVAPLMLGGGFTLAARALDRDVNDAVAHRIEGIGDIGDAMGHRIVFMTGTVGLFVAGQLAPDGRFRRATFDLAQGFVINSAITAAMKRSVGRQRPDTSNYRSFPSGHTSSFFTVATVLDRHFGSPVGIPATVVATFVAVSRVEDHEHFLSDVVAGGFIGYIVGRTVTGRLNRIGTGKQPFHVSALAVPRGAGLSLMVSF